MPLLDFVSKPLQRVAYLFPETEFTEGTNLTSQTASDGGFVPKRRELQDVFVFQFWPEQVQDNYTPNYATKNIPGGSHPIFQWTSGNGRDISFNAQFVAEIAESNGLLTANTSDFRSRITQAAAENRTAGVRASLSSTLSSLALPSSRYQVNVSAAIAALQQYLYPDYVENETSGRFARPPKKVVLVLPGTNLGRGQDADGILCIMRGASVTMESWFPSGQLRSATVSLRFSEVVQRTNGQGNVSNIKYIGSQEYRAMARKYTQNLSNPSELSI